MKRHLSALLAWVIFAASGFAGSVTINIPGGSGYALVCNPFDIPPNDLNTVFPTVPNGTTIHTWNCAAQSYSSETYSSAAGKWTPDVTIAPGEGFFIESPGSPASVTLTGLPPVPASNSYCGCGKFSTLGLQTTNATGTFVDLTGQSPVNGTEVYVWDEAAQSYNTLYSFGRGAWSPSEPVFTNGVGVQVRIPCVTNSQCLTVQCSTNKTVPCGSAWSFDMPTASSCCSNFPGTTTNVAVSSVSTVTNGVCPQVAITQTWLITDTCGDSNTCSQTVTVTGCCANPCCGPNLGAQTINWLPFPTNGTLNADGLGLNTNNTWLVTNLPCYGNVLITQDFPDPSPSEVLWFLNPNLANVPNAYGMFNFTETGYGPYSWGPGSVLDFYNATASPVDYTVNFYFLDGQPNPCTVYLGVIGLGQSTTATVSQPVAFRTEYDLFANAPGGDGYASADTTLDGAIPTPAGATGTVVGSAYSTNNIGDPRNTGWAVLQPTNDLPVTSLPAGSGTDLNGTAYPATTASVPYLTLAVHHESGDGIGFTMGYVCCTNSGNCLHVQCATNKTEACGAVWSFDPPTASTCCPSNIVTSTGVVTNVLVTALTPVTNGVCPQYTITETWVISDACGDTNVCSQVVTVNCCSNSCMSLPCPTNIVVTSCTNVQLFYSPIATDPCCSNSPTVVCNPPSGSFFAPGTVTTVYVTAFDACSNSANCSFTVTVNQGTASPPIISGPTNIVVCSGTSLAGYLIVDSDEWNLSQTGFTNEGISQGNLYVSNCLTYLTGGVVGGNILIYSDDFALALTAPDFLNAITIAGYSYTVMTPNGSLTLAMLSTNKAVFVGGDMLLPAEITALKEFVCAGGGVYIAAGTGVANEAAQWNALINPFGLNMATGYNGIIADLTLGNNLTTSGALPMTGVNSIYYKSGNDLNVICGNGVAQIVAFSGTNGLIGISRCSSLGCGPMPNATGEITASGYVGSIGQSIPPGTVLCADTNVVFTVTNGCGQTASIDIPVTLAPCNDCISLNCSNIVVSSCANLQVFYAPTATDKCCSNGVQVVCYPASGTFFAVGTTTTIYVTATDSVGNAAQCSFTVTVNKGANLQVTCPPATKTVQCGSVWVFDPPVTSASCCSNVVVRALTPVTNGVCPKVITETWLITDSCGDSNTCSQQVTLVDTTPPVVDCRDYYPVGIIVALNSNCDLIIPQLTHPRASDNCTPQNQLVYTQTPPAGTVYHGAQNIQVTVTVTDLCGNSSQCHVLVEGLNRIGPMLTAPATITVTNCVVPCVLPLVSATDCSCPPASLRYTQSPPCGTVLGPGQDSVTVTVTDCRGLRASKVIHLVITGSISFLANNLYNTGVVPSALLPSFAFDTHYTLSIAPAGVTTGQPVAAVPPLVPYSLLSPYSDWIIPNHDTNQGGYSDPAGVYTYKLPFTLPNGVVLNSVSISGRWAVDNGGGMYLNGTYRVSAIPQSYGFAQWTYFTIPPTAPFVTGINTLSFVVTNDAGGASYTALRVEFTNAVANCHDCVGPSIKTLTPATTAPLGGSETLQVSAQGTPPFGYQWYHNGVPIAGATSSSLSLSGLTYASGGAYEVSITNSCGALEGYTTLRIVQPWVWSWGWWNVNQVTSPLAANFGPDLQLVGTNSTTTNNAITAGTTEDFGLPEIGGQVVNVMHIGPLTPDTYLQIPPIAPTGSNSVASYTVLMDVYLPDSSTGTNETLFASEACCIGSPANGVAMVLDAQNNLHITGSADGSAFDFIGSTPLDTNAWDRIAMVVDNPFADGVASNLTDVTVSLYLNGQLIAIGDVPTTNGLTVDWSNIPPSILDPPSTDGLYATDIQFHGVALGSDVLAEMGSPDTGTIPTSTQASAAPVLTAAVSNGTVTLSWVGTSYALQETTDVSNDGTSWTDSTLPFTETVVSGTTQNTATADPSTNGPSKFYRLVFRP
jgi:hypothetical protein